MKIRYFDLTKFYILKPFYFGGDYQTKLRLLEQFGGDGRNDEYLE